MKAIFCLLALFALARSASTQHNLKLQVWSLKSDSSLQAVPHAEIFEAGAGEFYYTNKQGELEWRQAAPRDYLFSASVQGYSICQQTLKLDRDTTLQLIIKPLEAELSTVEVQAENNSGHLAIVEGTALYASKKSDLIDMTKVEGNLAANNPRAIYSKVAGLSVWENDNSGIQLNIGVRGMNPNRTASFNSRQNGYDISADALGYPELYYAPPAQALARIELVRGAASLQYGTQFGGMLNFVLKNGEDSRRPFHFTTENTVGSFGFLSTFNSISGSKQLYQGRIRVGKLSYYGYYLYKRGDGWRPNSDFNSHTGYFNISYKSNCGRLSLRLEQTALEYLAHQAGGLTDAEFSQSPRLSKRARNWFKVSWYITALRADYKINERLLLDTRLFYVHAGRSSLGNLQPINRPDYGDNRDYIVGQYRNLGNETRLRYRYRLGKQAAILVAGLRTYWGHTQQRQGYSNADSTGSRSDFSFLSNQAILRNDYRFPSYNGAIFAEQYTPITKKWSLTPGLRIERINTEAQGYYQNLILAPSDTGVDTLRNEAVPETRQLQRHILLAGIGSSYKPTESTEIYANFSQNYRAINFNDMRVSNPNQVIDSLLHDERGFNADLGFRGRLAGGKLRWDASIFYLSYAERIGNLQMRRPNAENPAITELYTLRTNVGNARVIGLETLVESDILAWFGADTLRQWSANVFINFSALDGRYTKTNYSATAGKKLEFVSPITLRTGLQVGWRGFILSGQAAYVGASYTDATNAETSANATVGLVPSYTVVDASLSWTCDFLRVQIGSNNLLNQMYFTRRATSYPGPGIIPADGRSFFVSCMLKF